MWYFNTDRHQYNCRSLFISLNINSDLFNDYIKNFYKNLNNQRVDIDRIPYIDSLHITLFKIHLKFPITNTDMFEKFKETLRYSAEAIRNSINTLTPTKLKYGHKSDTVTLFFDDYSQNILENICNKIKDIFNEAKIGNIETKYSYFAHITITKQTNKYTPGQYDPDVHKIQKIVKNFNKRKIPNLKPNILYILKPDKDTLRHRRDFLYLNTVEKLSNEI